MIKELGKRTWEFFNHRGNKIQIVTPDCYSHKYNRERYLEHGHAVDMFNAPDSSSDTIGGYPLGFFITRLVASTGNQTTAWSSLMSKLEIPEPGFPNPKKDLTEFMALPTHSFFVTSIIDVLQREARLEDETKIRFSERNLDNKYTIGDIKRHYGNLFKYWYEKEGVNILDSMLVAVRPNGLDWYAKELERRGFKVVILGHTHHFVDRVGYDNDGCWCKSSKFSEEEPIPRYIVIDANNKVTVVPWTQLKNVGRGEGIFRSVIGIILIILALFISRGFRWVLGMIGVALILTTIFGY